MKRIPPWADVVALALIALAAVCLLLLNGCSQADVDRAERMSVKANESLAVAAEALKVAQDLAAASNSQQAKDAVAAATKAFDVASQAAQMASDATVAAKKEQAAGGGTLAVIGAAILAGVGGWGGAVALIGRAVGKYKTALTLTAQHADSMERAETDADVKAAKDNAAQSQIAAGVFDLIAKARGK